MIPSVNFHLWQPCNMRCNFCFAVFNDVKKSILPKGHLQQEKAIEVVKRLAAYGFTKITFAGGEPTLCPWLPELIRTAKFAGMTTMIVTNGSNLTEEFLFSNRLYLDWIALSIDSLDDISNLKSGRANRGKTPIQATEYFALCDAIKKHGYGLKINTVVHFLNYNERLHPLILHAQPERWKLFEVLPVVGQNDKHIAQFQITKEQYNIFLQNHADLSAITTIASESNTEMRGTYMMVDPAGRFYDSVAGHHTYSKPILDIGVPLAIQQVRCNVEQFEARGGIYDWERRA